MVRIHSLIQLFADWLRLGSGHWPLFFVNELQMPLNSGMLDERQSRSG